EALAVLRSRGDLDADPAVGRRDLDVPAQRGFDDRDGHDAVQVVPLPPIEGMGLQLHDQDEVARRAAAQARVAAARHAHARAVAGPGRDRDLEPLALDHAPFAAAALAGAPRQPPPGAAIGAGPGEDHVAAACPQLPTPLGARAGHRIEGHVPRAATDRTQVLAD